MRKQITHNELIKRLNYNKQTGKFTWHEREIKSQYDKTWNKKHAGNETGYLRHNGYKVINLNGKEYPCSRLAWYYVYGSWPEHEVDHINGNRADNRLINLRIATRSNNAMNRGIQSNNSSGYKGVWKRKGLNLWTASINVKGKKHYLGKFKSPEDAHHAYIKKQKELHGEFARL